MEKLVIFDCDGVLVDSERLANLALIECLSEIQIFMPADEAHRRFKGRKLADCLSEIEILNSCTLPQSFEATFRQRMSENFEKKLLAIPGAQQAVASILFSKCVASNGPLEKTMRNLQLTNLAPYFGDNVFSAYTIQKWKPEPDLFLHACKEMDSEPNRCVVVEDSESGVLAALRGGFKVLAFGIQSIRDKNVIYFNSMNELPELVDAILNKN